MTVEHSGISAELTFKYIVAPFMSSRRWRFRPIVEHNRTAIVVPLQQCSNTISATVCLVSSVPHGNVMCYSGGASIGPLRVTELSPALCPNRPYIHTGPIWTGSIKAPQLYILSRFM